MEEKTIPHLVIKKVAKASQPMMEEYVNRVGGNVERIYYDKKCVSEYPYMFVVFTKEFSLNKAYVKINEDLPLYEVSLKPIIPKTKKACLECLKDSYLFCESCSAPYCSEVCQKKNWSEHCLKCMAMPKLVQVQWHDTVVEQVEMKVGDTVSIVGYDKGNASVTLRQVGGDKDMEYLDFLNECGTEAERCPNPVALYKDTKVWALLYDQWYRGSVESISGDKVTVDLPDISMKEVISKSNLRLLQNKDLFLRPCLTKCYRLKYVRQKDMLASPVVQSRMEQAILKKEKFTIKELAYNFVDLQVDGQPQSFNNKLIFLYERQTGLAEELEDAEMKESAPVVTLVNGPPVFFCENITYPEYERVMEKPQLFVISAVSDILGTWTIQGFNVKFKSEVQALTNQIRSVGGNSFKNSPPLANFQGLELNQLVLYFDGKLYHRCAYKLNGCFEDVDIGNEFKEVKPDQVRLLPRDLISKSFLMAMVLDDDDVEDMNAMNAYLKDLNYKLVSPDRVIHTVGNNFKVIWRKP